MATTTPTNPSISTSATHGSPAWPRYVNAAVGAWLFISAFVWAHVGGETTNAWLVGALMFCASLLAIGAPAIRFANTALAVWLFFSTIAMGATTATLWNHIIVSLVVFVVSFIPNHTSGAARPGSSAPNPA